MITHIAPSAKLLPVAPLPPSFHCTWKRRGDTLNQLSNAHNNSSFICKTLRDRSMPLVVWGCPPRLPYTARTVDICPQKEGPPDRYQYSRKKPARCFPQSVLYSRWIGAMVPGSFYRRSPDPGVGSGDIWRALCRLYGYMCRRQTYPLPRGESMQTHADKAHLCRDTSRVRRRFFLVKSD